MTTTKKVGQLPKATKRGKDLKILYTKDDLVDIRIRMRTIIDRNSPPEPSQPWFVTPVTPLLLARLVTGDCPITNSLTPRKIEACFGVPVNVNLEGLFDVYIPYHPTDPNHIEQIKEIKNFTSQSNYVDPPTPLSLKYFGEST